MAESLQDASHIINLIYETAEDAELWPTLIEFCHTELDDVHRASSSPDEHRNETDLAEHLDRALRLNRRLNEMQSEVGSAKKVLDYLPVAIMTVDMSCTVINLNRLAQKVVDASSGLLRIEHGKLVTGQESKQADVKSIICSALSAGQMSNKNCSIKLQGVNRSAISIFAVKTTDEHTQKNCCTLFIVSNFLSNHISPVTLKNMYQLTPAESRLAHRLLSGDSLKDIAEQLGITHNTARNQLKSIFAKTETNRQSELVGLLLSTPSGISNDSQQVAVSKAYAPETQTQFLTLSDGRRLCYYELGDPNGTPVIYFHEFIVWRWWSLIDDEDFRALGVRFIVMLRPGFLGTDFSSPLRLASWKNDFNEFIEHLRLQAYYALGFSSGGLFAIAAAYYFPKPCLGLALVSASAPLEAMSEMKDVKPAMSRLIMGFAKFAPRLYRRFFKGLLDTVQEDPMSYFRGYFSHWSRYDRQLIEDPRVLQNISESFKHTLTADSRGVSNEPLICTQALGFKLSDISSPTHIWRGADDNAVPHVLAEKLRAIPQSVVHSIPGAGHLFIYEYWREILSTLTQASHTND